MPYDGYYYEYDKLGQLVRFNDAVENKTYTYSYDNNGNILTKSEYAYTLSDALGTATNTTTYGYDTQWKDKLTSVGDKAIAYDNIGNPTSYLGATLAWEGRNLTSYETATQKMQYEYDENGMRYRTTITNKEDNSVGYLDYVWVDSKLISISFTSDELNQTVKYLYNDFDEPVGFVSTREDGSVDTYYYLKNAQGDITHIVSAAGKKMVSFTYDVFGKRTVEYQANDSTTPSQIELLTQIKADLLNPFAYRGYCYDYDMGMYYLQSRYYDPNTGRFINADDTNYLNATGTVLGCNLFAYCENDGVNFVDGTGCYSAEKAVKYAKKWTGGVNNQPDAVFHNKLYYFYDSGDCINFVSQCLHAGGLSMNNEWYSYRYNIRVFNKTRYYYSVSPAWRQVSKFYNYIQNSSIWSRSFEFWTNKNATRKERKSAFLKYSDLVDLGAVILMDFKFDGKTKYTHAALVVGVTLNDIKYAAHTSNRWWQSLWQMVENGTIERYIIYNISKYAI